jgi:hypothetical protein
LAFGLPAGFLAAAFFAGFFAFGADVAFAAAISKPRDSQRLTRDALIPSLSAFASAAALPFSVNLGEHFCMLCGYSFVLV